MVQVRDLSEYHPSLSHTSPLRNRKQGLADPSAALAAVGAGLRASQGSRGKTEACGQSQCVSVCSRCSAETSWGKIVEGRAAECCSASDRAAPGAEKTAHAGGRTWWNGKGTGSSASAVDNADAKRTDGERRGAEKRRSTGKALATSFFRMRRDRRLVRNAKKVWR